MSLGTAAEEIAWSDEIWASTGIVALREQQETDFGWWGPYEYKMPKDEGKWDEVTTNSGKALANKIMGLLSSSRLQLFIDVDEEEKKPNQAGRNKISDTERLANGSIWSADREITSVPSGKKTQSALTSFAVLRGGTAKSLYWYNDKEGNPRCDIKAYDPMFCQWEEGDKEIIKFCHRNYVTKRYLESTFKKQIEKGFNLGGSDTPERLLLYTFWDEDEWKVAVNGEYLDTFKHGLGYVPVNIRSCGPAPYLQSVEYQDTMKYSWMSYAYNTRDVYDLASKLLSIAKTKAIDSGRKDFIAEYDSTQGNPNEDVQKIGYGSGQRNNIVMLDSSKGHKFVGFVEAPGNEVVDSFYNRVRGELDVMATIDPIASGVMNRSGSGALAAELKSAALEFINFFRECVEADFVWLAEECVKQFKNGQYEKIDVEGRDVRGQKFSVNLAPSDVTEKHFDCKLVADRLRDKVQELGAAIQSVSYGLSSRKSAMLDHNLHEDPDKEIELIEQEKHAAMAAEDPVMHNQELANYYIDKGNIEMALYHMQLVAIAIQATMDGMMGGAAPEEGEKKPSTVSPQMQEGKVASEPRTV